MLVVTGSVVLARAPVVVGKTIVVVSTTVVGAVVGGAVVGTVITGTPVSDGAVVVVSTTVAGALVTGAVVAGADVGAGPDGPPQAAAAKSSTVRTDTGKRLPSGTPKTCTEAARARRPLAKPWGCDEATLTPGIPP